MKVLLLGASLKLVLVLMVMMIGRWSDDRADLVSHVAWSARLEEIVEMSGEVSCWLFWVGMRVCVSELRIVWLEPRRRLDIVSPL